MKTKLNNILFVLMIICSFFIFDNVSAATKTPIINLNQINSSTPNYEDYVSLMNRYKNDFSERYPYYFVVLTDSSSNNTLVSDTTITYKYIMFLFGDTDSTIVDLNVNSSSYDYFYIYLNLYSLKDSPQRMVSINSITSGVSYISQTTTINNSEYYMSSISRRQVYFTLPFDIYIDTNLPSLNNCYAESNNSSSYVDYYIGDDLFTKGSSLNVKTTFMTKKINNVLNNTNSIVMWVFGSLGILFSVLMTNSLLLLSFGVITLFTIIVIFRKLF